MPEVVREPRHRAQPHIRQGQLVMLSTAHCRRTRAGGGPETRGTGQDAESDTGVFPLWALCQTVRPDTHRTIERPKFPASQKDCGLRDQPRRAQTTKRWVL